MTLSINYNELGSRSGDSPLCGVGKKSHRGSRSIWVNWEDIGTALKEILGYPTAIVAGSTCTLSRELPEFHPTLPWMVATEANVVKGIKFRTPTDEGVNNYETCQIDINYESVDYLCLGDDDEAYTTELDRYVSYREERSADYLTIPQGGMYWSSAAPAGFLNTLIPFSTGKVVAYKELHYTWHELPYNHPPFGAIDDTVGRVNNADFDGYAAGTLLCMPPRTEIIRLADGNFGWEIEYIFRYAWWLHNKLFLHNPGGTSGYYQVNRTSGQNYAPGSIPDGQCIYDEADFSKLFELEVSPLVP